ncbi:amidohydrolase [Flavobacteriaceae bacterium TK19130]|nr:amidohydrolase [Thermobacterium salinum]
MSEKLSVTLLQKELHWEDPEANRTMFSKALASLQEQTDLIILPEMFPTGFSMHAEALAEPTEGPSMKWMQQQAKKNECAITGSVIVEDDRNFYNRLYFVFPDGTFSTYDKKHTFTLAGEHKVYSAGEKRVTVDYKGWKICPLVCYDLRFPVWARNTDDYDLLLYVANWPAKRVAAWDALLKARAIENMSYCIGVNRVGKDGNDHEYVGHSAVYDVLGERISKNWEGEFIETVTLEKQHIATLRDQLRFLQDRDAFHLD